MSWIVTWLLSLGFGLYLIFRYQDYFYGIPLAIFGSMILWGLIADLGFWLYDKATRINSPRKLDDLK